MANETDDVRLVRRAFRTLRKTYAADIAWLKSHGFREEADYASATICWKSRSRNGSRLEMEVFNGAKIPWLCRVIENGTGCCYYGRFGATPAMAVALMKTAIVRENARRIKSLFGGMEKHND